MTGYTPPPLWFHQPHLWLYHLSNFPLGCLCLLFLPTEIKFQFELGKAPGACDVSQMSLEVEQGRLHGGIGCGLVADDSLIRLETLKIRFDEHVDGQMNGSINKSDNKDSSHLLSARMGKSVGIQKSMNARHWRAKFMSS